MNAVGVRGMNMVAGSGTPPPGVRVISRVAIQSDAEAGREQETAVRITLDLLNAVDDDRAVTQRRIAADLGIAVGLVNAYLKRCIAKGLIKVQQVPKRRYAYYLTPKGFAEKSRLTASYLAHSLDFFRTARTSCEAALQSAADAGWKNTVLVGGSDLAEIAVICALNHPIEITAVVEVSGDTTSGKFASLPVFGSFDKLPAPCDGAVVTAINETQTAFDSAIEALGADKVILPGLLSSAVIPKAEGGLQ